MAWKEGSDATSLGQESRPWTPGETQRAGCGPCFWDLSPVHDPRGLVLAVPFSGGMWGMHETAWGSALTVLEGFEDLAGKTPEA